MSDRESMIEDYIPVKEISKACVREKLGGHHLSRGQIRNLHIWWARRPLAASRAAVYATFAPPVASPDQRRALPDFFAELCDYKGPVLPRTAALNDAEAVVSTAADGLRPRVLDLFAGGGAIPLEALRLGAEAVAVDLNPVAHLIQRCTLEFPQRYGARLRDAVETWGKKVIDDTRAEVGDLYPDIIVEAPAEDRQQGLGFGKKKSAGSRTLRPIAWLWTRTIPSTARGYEQGQVPLVRQTWLSYGAGSYVALRPVVDRQALTVRYELVTSSAGNAAGAIAEWGFDPDGDSARGATTCPYSGATVTADDAKAAGKAGTMGHQLMAVAAVEPQKRGKVFLAAEGATVPQSESEILVRVQRLAHEIGTTVPDEPLPEKLTGGMCSIYGLDTFDKLFTPRQKLTLLTLCKHVRLAHATLKEQSGDPDFAAAVAAYLGLLVGRVADRSSTLCRWDNTRSQTQNTFARQALPMVWDFSEANPFGGGSGDARNQLDYILEVLDHTVAVAPGRPATVIHGRAQRLSLPDASLDAVITDPPYYDNISYADLSDFFYVWHKRALAPAFPGLYAAPLTPKKQEAVAAVQRHGKGKAGKEAASAFYEAQMAAAFAECHRVLKPGAPLVVVYAHKTTLGWSTLVDALRGAGFMVTEAWPLATEMPDRVGQMDTASLASSIFLVARRREEGGVGDYSRDVRPELNRLIPARVRALMAAGITGADLVIASVGAGLRPFTRFDSVELGSGEVLPTSRLLDEIQRDVLECILSEVFQVDRSGVGRIDRQSRFYVLALYQFGLLPVEFGVMNVLAQGLGAELDGPGSLSDGKRRLVEQKKSEVHLRSFAERGAEPTLGVPDSGGATPPLIDVLHRALWLLDNDRAAIQPLLRQSGVDLSALSLLAHALKGRALAGDGDVRSPEQKAVDRLLAQWSRLLNDNDDLPLFNADRNAP